MRRKILSKKEQKNKDRFNQFLVGIVLIFIMLLSTLGYSLSGSSKDTEKKIIYQGIEFINQNGFWVTNVGNLKFIFKYNPQEVNSIEGEVKYLNAYLDKPLYFLSENSEASTEIYMNLDQVAQRTQLACLNQEDCKGDLPVKDCSNNFIIIEENNISEIIQNQSCVFIRGPKENLTKIADEFLFKILGIKE